MNARAGKNKQTAAVKSLHKRDCTVLPISRNKENDNMREVSIKLLAIMKAKKECSII